MEEEPFMVKLFVPNVSKPAVRVSVLATVTELPKVTPPAPFIVKLLMFAENKVAGKVSADPLVKANVALALLASILPLPEEFVIEVPEYVKVFAPVVKVLAATSNVPVTVAAAERLTPALLLIVKLFAPVKPVPVTCADEPLKV